MTVQQLTIEETQFAIAPAQVQLTFGCPHPSRFLRRVGYHDRAH